MSWRKRRSENQGEEQEEGDSTDGGASASLLPPRTELPAPTVTRQLRAAFYSCTHTGNQNQNSSAVHCSPPDPPPSLLLPP